MMKEKLVNITKTLVNDSLNFDTIDVFVNGKDINFQALAAPFYDFVIEKTYWHVHEFNTYETISSEGMTIVFKHAIGTNNVSLDKKDNVYILTISSIGDKILGDWFGVIRENLFSNEQLNKLLQGKTWYRLY